MELLNPTPMEAGYTLGVKPSGREMVVVVVKGTFLIPDNPGEVPVLASEQLPLVESDVFSGEPGFSATMNESEYVYHKPRCDVLLNGSAYAPGGKPTIRVTVSLRVGPLHKSFDVVGHRHWEKHLIGITATKPKPFTVMPISYDNAFGGVDKSDDDESKHQAYPWNPVGTGFHRNLQKDAIEGKPLPNTEETGDQVHFCNENYRPMAFGAVTRASQPRASYAGTYDQEWMEHEFPFLPKDFDERHFQAAPDDQQTDYLQGGETVELRNLCPQGICQFQLPQVEVPVEFIHLDDHSQNRLAVLDTLLLEPDQQRFTICWRTSVELRKNVFEIPQCVVGRMPVAWYIARDKGKTFYSSLDELGRDHD